MSLTSKKRQSLNEKFSKIIHKFNINDVQRHVLPVFEDLTWDLIKKAVVKYNLTTRMEDIGKLLLEYTRDFSITDLQTIYYNLLLLEVKLYHNKKMWAVVKMKQNHEIHSDDDCIVNIKKEFIKQSKNVNVYSDVCDSIRWVVIIVNKRTKNQGIVQQKPIYVAHPLNTLYMFHAPKNIAKDTLKNIISGFGYDDHKMFKLNGRNIQSLMTMLDRHKDADKLRTKTALALKNSLDLYGVRSSRGVDFCQDKVRATHAREIFGDNSIQLETLTVHAKTDWRGVRTLPEAEGKSMNVTMRLRSKDIRKSLEKLIESGVILPPYPIWLKEFLISGKNIMKIG